MMSLYRPALKVPAFNISALAFYAGLAVLLITGLSTPAAATGQTQDNAMQNNAVQTATVGEKAPDFTLSSAHGRTWTLSDLEGDIVVLEWSNHQCPFVRKHYETGNMQKLQNEARADYDVKWLTIVSSAPGKQGYLNPKDTRDYMDEVKEKATARLLDPDGDVGRLYNAKTTPHMYVIDKDGTLVYAGAIDDNPSSAHSAVRMAKNHVQAALKDLDAGRAVRTPQTRAYGCTVKY